MRPFRRRRFGDLIDRQLALFADEEAELIAEIGAAERAYDRAARDEAEERYGVYDDLVDTATQHLADVRDHYAASLAEGADDEYRAEFDRAVRKRWPPFAAGIDER